MQAVYYACKALPRDFAHVYDAAFQEVDGLEIIPSASLHERNGSAAPRRRRLGNSGQQHGRSWSALRRIDQPVAIHIRRNRVGTGRHRSGASSEWKGYGKYDPKVALCIT